MYISVKDLWDAWVKSEVSYLKLTIKIITIISNINNNNEIDDLKMSSLTLIINK